MVTNSHSFYACPLRSSSLLIVNQLDQTIITATDEVFDSLGYRPCDLMGHSILTLALQQQHQQQHQYHNNQMPSSCRRYYARHAARGQVSLEICVHHDPFGATDSLDYWLIRLNAFAPQPATILRLSPYGTIEYCQPAPSFHQLTSEMLGRPIMGFIHSDDVPAFCAHLNNTAKSKTHTARTFRTRWSKYALQDLPEDYNNTKHYDWMSLTAVTTGHRTGSPTDAFQCRPLCILQPVPGETVMEQARRVCIEYLQGMVGQCAEFSSSAMDMVTIAVIEGWHQGKTYSLAFLAHLLASLLDHVQHPALDAPLGDNILLVDNVNNIELLRFEQDDQENEYRRVETLRELVKSVESTLLVQHILNFLGMAGLVDRSRCVTDILETSLDKEWMSCLKMQTYA